VDAILNWIWQGTVVAIVTTVALVLIERSRASDRYLTVWVALLSVLALPVVPFVMDVFASPSISGATATATAPVWSLPSAWWTSNGMVIGLWATWATVATARYATAAIAVRRLKRVSTAVRSDVQSRLSCWAAVAVRGRVARLRASTGVQSAAVLGFGSPIIAVSPALFAALSDEELDRIVIHEWAHVQRRDDLAHVAQACIHLLAGWHPAVWWLGRLLRAEREIACDELAVAVTGSAKGYAASLVKLAGLSRVPVAPVAAVAALGSVSLQRRVHRILSVDRRTSSGRWRIAAGIAAAVPCVLAATLGGIQAIEAVAAIADERITAAPVRTSIDGPAPLQSKETVVETPSSARAARASRGTARAIPVTSTQSSIVTLPQAADTAHSEPVIGASSIATAFTVGAPAAPISNGNTTSQQASGPWRDLAAGSAAAGVGLGSQSRQAAVTSAAYFTRLGKRIASSF
jgi:bla regulator protein blaR1